MLPVLRNLVRVSIKVGHGDSLLQMEGTWKLLDFMVHLGLPGSLAPKRTVSFKAWGVRGSNLGPLMVAMGLGRVSVVF